MGKSSDGGISDFLISAQSLLKENCHNSRTSDDIDMKLEKKKNLKQNSFKNIVDDVMSNIVM